jgi:hypothetical protein
MSIVTINGRRIEVQGNCISIVNNQVYVNGKLVDSEVCTQPVKLIVEGNAMNVTTRGSVEVQGNVLGSVDLGGSINCGNVGGSIDAGGSVHCGNVGGNIDAGGSVHCSRRGN